MDYANPFHALGLILFFVFSGYAYAAEEHQHDSHHKEKKGLVVISKSIPQDKEILYISINEDDKTQRPWFAIKAVNRHGKNEQTILEVYGAQIFSLTPSLNGNSFVFSVGDLSAENSAKTWMNGHLWLYENGTVTQLTSGMVRDTEVVWSENSQRLYMMRSNIQLTENGLYGESVNLWSLDIESNTFTKLLINSDEVGNMFPSLRVGDSKIYFSSNREGNWHLYSMEKSGGEEKRFVSDAIHGKWSPDGQYFAYVDTIPGDIYLADEKGEIIEQLTEGKLTLLAPSWSPDSRSIIYSKINPDARNNNSPSPLALNSEPHTDVWRLKLDKVKKPHRITRKGLSNTMGVWLPARGRLPENEVLRSLLQNSRQ